MSDPKTPEESVTPEAPSDAELAKAAAQQGEFIDVSNKEHEAEKKKDRTKELLDTFIYMSDQEIQQSIDPKFWVEHYKKVYNELNDDQREIYFKKEHEHMNFLAKETHKYLDPIAIAAAEKICQVAVTAAKTTYQVGVTSYDLFRSAWNREMTGNVKKAYEIIKDTPEKFSQLCQKGYQKGKNYYQKGENYIYGNEAAPTNNSLFAQPNTPAAASSLTEIPRRPLEATVPEGVSSLSELNSFKPTIAMPPERDLSPPTPQPTEELSTGFAARFERRSGSLAGDTLSPDQPQFGPASPPQQGQDSGPSV